MNKIADLMDRLERVKLAQDDAPPDDHSRSLWEFGAELAALDEAGIKVRAEKWDITPDAVREMARTYAR